MKKFFLRYKDHDATTSLALFIFRIAIGGMMLTHGLPKLSRLSDGTIGDFRDPLGIGSTISYFGALYGEILCAIAIIAGLYTRLSAVGMGFVMFVAGFIVHAEDSFSAKEKALLFLTASVLLLFTGGGRYSLDRAILRK